MREHRFAVPTLGPSELTNPISNTGHSRFVTAKDRLLSDPSLALFEKAKKDGFTPESFEIAGPSEKIYFSPARTKAAIVTCGGLCPGINAVIRALVMQLWYRYGVKNIVGVRYGYQGLGNDSSDGFWELDPTKVMNIHQTGGSFLGSSRGSPPVAEIVDTLQRTNINILFVIGGDGTMRGASALTEEVKRRHLSVAIVAIPKTIDNDIPFVRRSFGFETAVAAAAHAAYCGHNEAKGAPLGIGLVKLMGRHSGYIAANVALATGHANYCLIPEVDFSLEGPTGLLAELEKRMAVTDHTLIVVAEGAGQKYFQDQDLGTDPSGNPKLADVGVFLKDEIKKHFHQLGQRVSVKYIDPSYMIRSLPANPADNLFCANLAQNAVHAAMAGKTGIMVGYWHGRMTYVPLTAIKGQVQKINPDGDLWFNVLEMTGQPAVIGG